MTLPRDLITIGITVTFMFHDFWVLWQVLGTYLSFRFPSVLFCCQPERQRPHFSGFSFFFLLTIAKCGRLAEINRLYSKSTPKFVRIFYYYYLLFRVFHIRCPWCNGYHRRKWTRRHEFKSWTRLTAFHIALIPLGKVWIQLFSLQLWVNSWTD